ncbi:hypothetical protein LK09_06605 [Microbacterium mangrovi]|uniref:Uncharacterized protein n=1 Tax=Microbacterium mangrovi TaxID=1348253 RepID=A0A0B2A528_9MICO|nr:hypothetical protein [Microbacterium mangrovi]KHK98619.1 hypothetical protein LK09_06605 [Microbacterium mangrovi]
MGYAVLGAWTVQAVVGVTLFVGWLRHGRGHSARPIVTHAITMVSFSVPWIAFLATGLPLWAWVGFGILLVFIGFGDYAVVQRTRAVRGETNPGLRDELLAVKAALSGRFGGRLVFHALWSPVVFFGSLGVAIGATVAA